MSRVLHLFIILILGMLTFSSTGAHAKDDRKCSTPKFNCGPRNNARQCLICNCFFESRGESELGQKLVLRTVIARTKSNADNWPDTVCGVVYDKDQFSWTRDDIPNSLCPSWPEAQTCIRNTDQVIRNPQSSTAPLWFHTPQVKPLWRKKLKLCKVGSKGQVGNHIFYCAQAKPAKSSGKSSSKASR